MTVANDLSASSRLCSACGLCCNGVMFHTVRLQPRDSAKELVAIGLKLKRRNKHHYIQQPCPAYRCSQCSIYDRRPERCRLFECRQLKGVAAGEITESAALANIRDVQQRVEHLNALLEQGGGTDPKRPLSKRYEKIMVELLSDPSQETTALLRAELTAAMEELDAILDEDFRLPAIESSEPADPSADDPQWIAVYGTLMRGNAGQRLAGIQGQLTYVGPCTLPGVLYDLGDYPGMIAGEGAVKAEIYSLCEPGVLAKLDRYEGCFEADPNALFVRRRVRLDAVGADCWVYFYNRDVTGHLPIPTGDWIGYRGGR